MLLEPISAVACVTALVVFVIFFRNYTRLLDYRDKVDTIICDIFKIDKEDWIDICRGAKEFQGSDIDPGNESDYDDDAEALLLFKISKAWFAANGFNKKQRQAAWTLMIKSR